MLFSQRIVYTLLVVSSLMAMFFFATSPTRAYAACDVTSAKFVNYYGEQHDSFYAKSGTSFPTVIIDVQTSGCVGEYIRIRPSDPTVNTGTTTEALVMLTTQTNIEKRFLVPEGGLVRAFLVAGETTCNSDPLAFDCDYHIRVYPDVVTPTSILYSSMSTPQGRLKYNCAGVCGSDWSALSFPGGLTPTEACFLMPATFSPAGVQPANFYSDEQRPIVTVTIPTINCAGKVVKVSLVEEYFNTDADVLNDKEITVPLTGTVIIELKSSDEHCYDDVATSLPAINGIARSQCSVHIKTRSDLGVVGTTSKNRLEFSCDENGCDDTTWFINKHNGTDEDGNPVYDGNEVAAPDIDPTNACAVTDSAGVTTLKDDCYALLAPIGNTDRIEGATIGKYVNIVINIIISVAGVLAVIMIVVGGVQYMTTDAFAGKSDARETITKALLGLILALGSYLILKTINPNLLKIEPNIQSIALDVKPWGDIQSLGSASYQSITGKPLPTGAEIKALAAAASQTVGVDNCVALTLLAIESGGKADAIGHDENVDGTRSHKALTTVTKLYSEISKSAGVWKKDDDTVLKKDDADLGLDWRFSHGIGALQITFFPIAYEGNTTGYSGTNYTTSPPPISAKKNVPSRTLNGITYTPKQMLDAEKNLEAGLRLWKQNFGICDDIRKAFVMYNGGSCDTTGLAQEYGDTAKATYDSCKEQTQ